MLDPFGSNRLLSDRSRKWGALLLPLVFWAASASASRADVPAYHAEFLGTALNAAAMNQSGLVVGTTTIGGNDRGWVAGRLLPLTPLPLPVGMLSSSANDINDSGMVVGEVSPYSSTQFSPQAAAWHPDGDGGYTVEILGVFPGDDRSYAFAVNNVGDIVGTSAHSWFGRPVRYAPEGIEDLSWMGDFSPASINDQRVLIGGSPTCKRVDLDTMSIEDLGIPSGNFISAQGFEINASGQVAGFAGLSSGGNCTWEAARYTDGDGWQILSSCGPTNAARDINDNGDVIMQLNIAPYVNLVGEGTFLIEDLIQTDVGHWYPINGYGITINNARQMAIPARNLVTGETGIVLLTPETAGSAPVLETDPTYAFFPPSPNPAAGPVVLRFRLERPQFVRMTILDPAGRRIRLLELSGKEGVQHQRWDGRDESGRRVGPGAYFVRLEAGPYAASQRLILLR